MYLHSGILPFFIGIGIIIIFIIFINASKSAKSCGDGEGLVYNDRDIGSYFGLGGYTCEICDNNVGHYIDADGYCKKCTANKFYDGEKCISCPRGMVLDRYTQSCQCDNRGGYFDVNGECLRCAGGNYYYNGQCLPCSNGRIINNACVCNNNYGLVDGVCKNCTGGNVTVDGECICPLGRTLTPDSGCR
jgi:hypothetical protein